MANVFGGNNNSGSCGSGEIISAPRHQVTSSPVSSPQPNVFRDGGSASTSLNPRDFYTRREIDKYLVTNDLIQGTEFIFVGNKKD